MAAPQHLRTARWAEDQALAYLEQRGLQRLGRNFRCRLGEIDLIMTQGALIVFVEVRFRRSHRYGAGFETVTRAKQRRLLAAARIFLSRDREYGHLPCRFDVVSVTKRNYLPDFYWVKDAFDQDA